MAWRLPVRAVRTRATGPVMTTMPLESSAVRKLIVNRLNEVKRTAAARRERVAEAEREYAAFLPAVAVPAFTLVAQVLSAEGYPHRVTTPGAGVRMASDRAQRTYVDLRLDTSGPAPVVMAEVSRERGHRVLVDDRPLGDGRAIASLTDEDVVQLLAGVVGDLIER